jgi:hypothetical protein
VSPRPPPPPPPPPLAASPIRRLQDRIAAHLGSHDVARVIYGAIIGLALVLALQAHPPSAGAVVGVIVATALAVGLAEVYSEILGAQAHTRRNVERAQLRVFASNALAVVFGAAFPALFFVLAAIGLIEVHTAFTLSKWTGLGLICTYGFVAARLTGAGIGRSLLEAAAVGAVGGVLIAVKALLH